MILLISLLLVLPLTSTFPGGANEAAGIEAKANAEDLITVTDSLGRAVTVPKNPRYVLCSGPGSLRLLSYLQCQDKVIAVDDMEGRRPQFDARPYALANPQFKQLPLFGEFRGRDNPELIVALEPQPEVIFKTFPDMGTNPLELENKTGIPVVALSYGDLFGYKQDLYKTIRTMAAVMAKEPRGEEVISFLENSIADLESRTADIKEETKRSCYIGGIAFKGPHGFQSTEPAYPPFLFVNAHHVAYDPEKSLQELQHADVAKEKIVAWDPDVIFVDLATLQSDPQVNALYELEHDPAYGALSAVKNGDVYGVLPYNWYTRNFGSIIADAYFVGKILYPERFADVLPSEKADEIYTFLVGKAVFREMNDAFQDLVFKRIPIE